MLKYKINVLQELKNRGFSTYILRKRGLFGQGDITKLNNGAVLGINGLNRLCELLKMQPGRILQWIPDPSGDPADTSGEQ